MATGDAHIRHATGRGMRLPHHHAAGLRPILGRALRVAAVALLAGCAAQSGKNADEQPAVQVVWPAPPDPARFVHEASLRRSADIETLSAEKSLRRNLTGEGEDGQPAFLKPGALAAREGRVYIADTVGRQICVFDLGRRKVFRFGFRTPGTLTKPSGLALDGAGNVYVADTTQRVVQVYDSLGLYIKTLGDPRELVRPVGVAVDAAGTRVYVVDRATNESDDHRIVIYDGNNGKLGTIGRRGTEPGNFNVPLAAAMGPNDTLHVLDAGNFRVQVFDAQGGLLHSFGQVGAGYGNFARPRGIAVDAEGNIYVTDASFGNFQIFNAKGELLMHVGQLSKTDAPGRYALASGIAVDETRHVFVSDQFFNKVDVFRRLTDAEAVTLARDRRIP
jgi:DNA-binding beta-propeller fold protein YncE